MEMAVQSELMVWRSCTGVATAKARLKSVRATPVGEKCSDTDRNSFVLWVEDRGHFPPPGCSEAVRLRPTKMLWIEVPKARLTGGGLEDNMEGGIGVS